MALHDPLRYTIAVDVERRLRNTFVRYKGKAFYIVLVHPGLEVSGYFLSDADLSSGEPPLVTVHSSDKELDIESPPLGWANIFYGKSIRPLFFMRTIHRQFQQGIAPARVQFIDPMLKEEEILFGYRFSQVAALKPFSQMIDGVGYPNIATALETKHGAAFDRHWAFIPPSLDKGPWNTLRVYHDGVTVALYSKREASFLFARKMLTKTRRASLEGILENPENNKVFHAVSEQE